MADVHDCLEHLLYQERAWHESHGSEGAAEHGFDAYYECQICHEIFDA